jgi:hypothetical protein
MEKLGKHTIKIAAQLKSVVDQPVNGTLRYTIFATE